jgi:hypothetical protein
VAGTACEATVEVTEHGEYGPSHLIFSNELWTNHCRGQVLTLTSTLKLDKSSRSSCPS